MFFNRVTNFLIHNRIAQVIIGALAVVTIIVLVIMGASLIGSILLVLLVGLVVYFGSIRELAGSALLAVLLKMMSETIQSFVAILTTGPWVESLFTLVNSTGYFTLIMVFFFFFYLLSFGTGSIRLIRFSNSVTNEQKSEE